VCGGLWTSSLRFGRRVVTACEGDPRDDKSTPHVRRGPGPLNLEAGLLRVPTSWAMLYQADEKTYYLNLHAVAAIPGQIQTLVGTPN